MQAFIPIKGGIRIIAVAEGALEVIKDNLGVMGTNITGTYKTPRRLIRYVRGKIRITNNLIKKPPIQDQNISIRLSFRDRCFIQL